MNLRYRNGCKWPSKLSRFNKRMAALFVPLVAIFSIYRSTSTIQDLSALPAPSPKTVNKNTGDTSSNSTKRLNLTSDFLFSKDDINFKPTTQLSGKECHAMPSQPPKKIELEYYDHIRNLTDLTTIHGEIETSLAICNLNEQDKFIKHFPHLMQQLYMCYTFWQDNPSRFPVLYIHDRKNMNEIFSNNPFLKGFPELLVSQLHVEILTHAEILHWINIHTDTDDGHLSFLRDRNETIDFIFSKMKRPIGYVLSHVDELNEITERQFDFDDEGDRNRDTYINVVGTQCSPPRIGILNRKPMNGRSILNAESLVEDITTKLIPGSANVTSSSSVPVSLVYFEGQTFEEQVQFFQDIDILISPHGAQLTGLPFMANKKCAKLIEVFPDKYLLPDYFGTLAVDSGIDYSYVYMSESPPNLHGSRGRVTPETARDRKSVRQKNICLDTNRILTMLYDATLHWCECRESRMSQYD